MSTDERKEISIASVLIKGVLFGIAVFAFIVFILTPQYSYGYNASVIDKVNRLEAIKEPKIILVGNSNVAFGFRSDLIEEAFGMPVVNAGLHGDMGNYFHENLALYNLNKGDIVVECPTSFGDEETEMRDHTLALITVENHIGLWKYIPKQDIKVTLEKIPNYLKLCSDLFIKREGNYADYNNAYSRCSFNEYGDNIFSDNNPAVFTFPEGYSANIPIVYDEYASHLNDVNKKVNEKGATMYIAAFPIAEDGSADLSERIKTLENDIDNKIECQRISNYDDYVYSQDNFYNSVFHLNTEAAIDRTNRLIDDLKKVIK